MAFKPSKAMRRRNHGEDFLSGIEAIALVLENGKKVQFQLSDEIPSVASLDDPAVLDREAKAAPGRFAFWAYQTRRAEALLRKRQHEEEKAWSQDYLLARTHIQDYTVESPTENNVRAHMLHNESDAWKTARERASDARRQYDACRALRDALEHRSHLLRRLIAQQSETFSGPG